MTQMGQGPYGRKPARSNVFTVLVFVAFVVLAVGVGFVWWKNYELFKTHPFAIVPMKKVDAAGHRKLAPANDLTFAQA